jgi:RsiW-degrading membrane proteinase PrsW (M82 family)
MALIILTFLIVGGLLVWYLLGHDHGRRLPARALWTAGAFGLLGMLGAAFFEDTFLPHQTDVLLRSMPLGRGFLYFLGVGFTEEIFKFLPLALFIYKKPYFKEHTDGVIFFALCGLTFGMVENILYTLQLGPSIGIVRLLVTPFFHAAGTSILGYYLINYKLHKTQQASLVTALLVVPVLHGLYDFGLYSRVEQLIVMSLAITMLFTLALFLYFMRANELDRSAAVPVAVHNYCSACGHANAHHTVFCENCGHRL